MTHKHMPCKSFPLTHVSASLLLLSIQYSVSQAKVKAREHDIQKETNCQVCCMMHG